MLPYSAVTEDSEELTIQRRFGPKEPCPTAFKWLRLQYVFLVLWRFRFAAKLHSGCP